MTRAASKYAMEMIVLDGVPVLKLLSQQYFSDSQAIFAEHLAKAEAATVDGLVVLDLGEVQQLTSGPLGALRASHRRLAASGGRIVAAGGGEFAVRVLSFAANFIDHFPNVEAAMKSVAPGPNDGRT